MSHNLFSCFRIFKTDPTHKCSTGTFNGVKHDYLVLNIGLAVRTLEQSKFVRSLSYTVDLKRRAIKTQWSCLINKKLVGLCFRSQL